MTCAHVRVAPATNAQVVNTPRTALLVCRTAVVRFVGAVVGVVGRDVEVVPVFSFWSASSVGLSSAAMSVSGRPVQWGVSLPFLAGVGMTSCCCSFAGRALS